MNSTIVTIVLLSLFSFTANAQDIQKIDLNQAIALGVKSNQNVQANELETKVQSQLIKSAFELPKTELSGTFGQINSQANDKNFSINQSFSPFQIGAKRKLYQEYSNASQAKLVVSKQDVTYNIRQSWNAMLFYEKQNRLLEKQNLVLQKFVKSAVLKFQTGETNALEKSIAVAKQQELEQSIKQNKTKIEVEKSKLKALLNLNNDFTVSDTSFVPLPFIAKSDSTLVQQNPVLKLASQQVKVAQANRKVEQSALYPDFSAGYFLQSITGYQDVNGQPTYYNSSPRFQGFFCRCSCAFVCGQRYCQSKGC